MTTHFTPIPVNEPDLSGNEKKYLNECIDSGWISSEGPFVKKFEDLFAERVGRKYGIAVANGSVALDLAVVALGIGPGDEVIVPAFTIISCLGAIVRAGATPVLVDSDPVTWNMDVSQIEAVISKKTKAIMVVHIYGFPVDMDPVLELTKKYDLLLIEDAAEMHGQTYRGKPCGSFGTISTFSFYPNKHITTGEGGMVVVNDPLLADTCRSLRNLCFIPEKRFYHEELGWNFRMTNLQAALGVAQLERLDSFVQKKRHMGALYRQLLGNNPHLELQPERLPYASNIYWVFGIVLSDTVPFNAASVMKKLAAKQVGTRPFFFPMNLQPVFNKSGLFRDVSMPVAERLSERGFYVPSGLGMTDHQIHEVSGRLLETLHESL